jgi:hypothetical protein
MHDRYSMPEYSQQAGRVGSFQQGLGLVLAGLGITPTYWQLLLTPLQRQLLPTLLLGLLGALLQSQKLQTLLQVHLLWAPLQRHTN